MNTARWRSTPFQLLTKSTAASTGRHHPPEIYLTDEGYENSYQDDPGCCARRRYLRLSYHRFLPANAGLVRRMAEEGHLVCNHSVHHYSMPELDGKNETEILGLSEAYQR